MSNRKPKIEIALALAALLLLLHVPICRADYTIDANLSDWGVTPFTDWEPDGTADYNETDDLNIYNASGFVDEGYDFEALYFDDDAVNFYFACVTSLLRENRDGDLGIDLNGDASISSDGVVTGLEYAIRICTTDYGNIGDVVVNPIWSDTWQYAGYPRRATGGTVVGSAEVAIQGYPELESGTYIFEVAVPRHLFNDVLETDDPVTCHISASCGNDSINLVADVNVNTPVRMYIRCDRDSTASPTVNRMLADDFQRNNTGRVTKVFLWGGWKDNIKGQIDTIHLSLHADDNSLDPNSPGTLLWSGDFTPADFNETYYAQDNGWFWDPATGQDPCLAVNMDIWQYEISIDPYYAFVHQGDPCDPCSYWLDAHVVVQPDTNNPQFTLKTTIDHWNHDAVSWSDSDTNWEELRYPEGHPFEPNSIDLAFTVTSSEANLPNQEWIQPPIPIDPNDYLDPNIPTYDGWDQESRYYAQDVDWFDVWNCPTTQCHGDADMSGVIDNYDVDIVINAWLTTYPDPCYDPNADFDRDLDVDYDDLDILTWWLLDNNSPPGDCPPQKQTSSWKLVADDFRPLGTMPITSIRWWGSYSGWPHMERPFNGDPNAWRIGFWSSNTADPCNPASFRPAKLLWQIEVENMRVKLNNVGRYEDLDTCFMYSVQLKPNEVFRPADHNSSTQQGIFWLSIAAVYPNGGYIEFPWGWNTRPSSWRYPAVTFDVEGPLNVNDPAPPNAAQLKRLNKPYDVAFELDTDLTAIKWQQPFVDWWRIFNHWDIRFQGWKHYEDQKSMAACIEPNDPNIECLVADDWKCQDQKPVTAITWWGSYIGYVYDPYNSNPAPPPIPPKYFLLSIWNDVPRDDQNPFSHPGDIIWSYKAYAYDQAMVGYDKHRATDDIDGDIDGDLDVDTFDLSAMAHAWLTSPGQPHWNPRCDISVPQNDVIDWFDFAVLAQHWLSRPGREPVFRYSVTLPDPNRFQQTGQGNIFWLSIVAVYPDQVTILYPWGWTNHRHAFNDDAVAGHLNDQGRWEWNELYDQTGMSEDMSFVLFTQP